MLDSHMRVLSWFLGLVSLITITAHVEAGSGGGGQRGGGGRGGHSSGPSHSPSNSSHASSHSPSNSSHTSSAPVHVSGYTRSNGSYITPHMRSAPDGNVYNNWTTRGNINPYTGVPGTKSPFVSAVIAARNNFNSYSVTSGGTSTVLGLTPSVSQLEPNDSQPKSSDHEPALDFPSSALTEKDKTQNNVKLSIRTEAVLTSPTPSLTTQVTTTKLDEIPLTSVKIEHGGTPVWLRIFLTIIAILCITAILFIVVFVYPECRAGLFLRSNYTHQKVELHRITAILTSKLAHRVNKGMALGCRTRFVKFLIACMEDCRRS